MADDRQFEIFYPVIVFISSLVIAYIVTKCKLKGVGYKLIGRCMPNWFNPNPLQHLKIIDITDSDVCSLTGICTILWKDIKEFHALGFDCEWVTRGGKQHPVALLQLASESGLCALFHLTKFNAIPYELKFLLEDKDILKLGICPEDDAKLLLKDYGIQVKGCMDLRHMYPNSGGGLASLAKEVLGVTLNKDWRVRCSNWEAMDLTEEQKDYAAKDALVAIEIYKKWSTTGKYAMSRLLRPDNIRNSRSHLISYKDVRFNSKACANCVPLGLNRQQGIIPECRFPRNGSSGFITRRTPLYHNCFMHAPDGELLCSCDTRKAEWYVSKGLAEVMATEPYSIRLLFEPSGRAGRTKEGRFYTQLKKNCCVVCGAAESYVRHNVVPREYRKHFPAVMKDHQSHDIVLTCVQCHRLASAHDLSLRQQLADKCSAPLRTSKTFDLTDVVKMQRHAKALLTSADTIPQHRKTCIENYLKNYFNVDAVTEELLNNALNMPSSMTNNDYIPHGLKVVKFFIEDAGGLLELEKVWREHFLDKMKPKFLPKLWSVDHNHERLTKRAAENRVQQNDLDLAGLTTVTMGSTELN